jgi:DNA-binding NarL/FixJ family response regulator
MKTNILIVDDHQLFREGLSQMIDREPDLHVCGGAADCTTAVDALTKLQPDMAIIDISLPDNNGIDLIKQFRAVTDEMPILVISMHDESLYAERALRAGANGYIMKQEANKKVRDAIRKVISGEIYLSEKMSNQIVAKLVGGREQARSPIEGLSPRELEVFELIGQGHGTRKIAESLKLTIPTINSFRARIKEKLNVKTASELVLQAIQWVHNKQQRLP